MSDISPLSTEFLYELYATALRQDHLCAIVSQHMRSEYLPDRSFQRIQKVYIEVGKLYNDNRQEKAEFI